MELVLQKCPGVTIRIDPCVQILKIKVMSCTNLFFIKKNVATFKTAAESSVRYNQQAFITFRLLWSNLQCTLHFLRSPINSDCSVGSHNVANFRQSENLLQEDDTT